MKRFEKVTKATALALAMAGAFGASGSAQAGVLAQNVLQVLGFQFNFVGPFGPPVSVLDFSGLGIVDSATNDAKLQGAVASQSAGSIALGSTVDAAQACLGGVCPAQNNFAQNVPFPAPGTQYARADSLLFGVPINTFVAPVGAFAFTVAEVQLTKSTDPTKVNTGFSELGLDSTFTFSVAGPVDMYLSFFADNYLRAAVSADSKVPGSSARANSQLTFDLTDADTGTTLFSWAPNGAVGGITGGVEDFDQCNLNRGITALTVGANNAYSCVGVFSAHTSLVAGNYEFGITHKSSASAQQLIPEPGTLALAGIGLIGAFAARRRAEKSAKS